MSEETTPNPSEDKGSPTPSPALQSTLSPTPDPSEDEGSPTLPPTFQPTLSPTPDITPNPSEDEAPSSSPPPPLSPTVQLTQSPNQQLTPSPSDEDDSPTAPPPATPSSTPSPSTSGPSDGEIIPAPLPFTPTSPTSRPWSPLPLNTTSIPARGYAENSDSIPNSTTLLDVKENITIVLAGKSGAGKSTLVKNVFGINFNTRMSAASRTKNIQEGSVTHNGITLKIVDTAGLGRIQAKKQLKQISKHVSGTADLLLYCLPVGPGSRFEDRNPEIMRSLQDAFGKDIWQHCMVVLTFSNLAWNQIKRSNRNREEAITKYKEYVLEYAAMFEEELRRLEVENPSIKTVFDLNPRTQDNGNCFLCIPAGQKHDDPVLAGNQYRIAKIATSFLSAKFAQSFSASAHEKEYGWETRFEVITDSWAAVLVCLILQRCPPGCSMAPLQFWYGRKRIGAALKQTGVPIALGGGSATGGAVGGAVGAAVGGVLGAPGGPVGIPIGITFGFGLGLVIGTVLGGGGAAGVTGAVGHALDTEKKTKKNDQSQEEQESAMRNSIIL